MACRVLCDPSYCVCALSARAGATLRLEYPISLLLLPSRVRRNMLQYHSATHRVSARLHLPAGAQRPRLRRHAGDRHAGRLPSRRRLALEARALRQWGGEASVGRRGSAVQAAGLPSLLAAPADTVKTIPRASCERKPRAFNKGILRVSPKTNHN